MKAITAYLVSHLGHFFGAVLGSTKGVIIPEELLRSIMTALGTGSLVSFGLTIVTAISGSVALIFPNPIVGGLATLVLTLLGDMLRRLQHGAPQPSPAPVPADSQPSIHVAA